MGSCSREFSEIDPFFHHPYKTQAQQNEEIICGPFLKIEEALLVVPAQSASRETRPLDGDHGYVLSTINTILDLVFAPQKCHVRSGQKRLAKVNPSQHVAEKRLENAKKQKP